MKVNLEKLTIGKDKKLYAYITHPDAENGATLRFPLGLIGMLQEEMD